MDTESEGVNVRSKNIISLHVKYKCCLTKVKADPYNMINTAVSSTEAMIHLL